MITKKELLQKINEIELKDISFANAWVELRSFINSIPNDEPTMHPFEWPVPDGYEVVTRDGRKVEQLHKFSGVKFPVIGVMDGRLESWKDNGSYNGLEDNASDLFLRPIEKKVWVVNYTNSIGVKINVVCNTIRKANEIKANHFNATIYEAILKEVNLENKFSK